MSLLKFSEITKWIDINRPLGVFADTSILFSATYSPDRFNDESAFVFNILSDKKIPVFGSVNVRAEFLENHRRVSIADALVDFLEDMHSNLNGPLLLKLQTHRKIHREKIAQGRNTRIDVNQIKIFRSLLKNYSSKKRSGWQLLCQEYVKPQLAREWQDLESSIPINFISTSINNQSELLTELPDWDRVIEIIGNHGIGSSDAMILNIFLCSQVPVFLTADLELAEAVACESQNKKIIFAPDSLFAFDH